VDFLLLKREERTPGGTGAQERREVRCEVVESRMGEGCGCRRGEEGREGDEAAGGREKIFRVAAVGA
jgi:hypothetical protein